MKPTAKEVLRNAQIWEIIRVTQGTNSVRLDAQKRFNGSERYSEWISKSYFKRLCKDYGRSLTINY